MKDPITKRKAARVIGCASIGLLLVSALSFIVPSQTEAVSRTAISTAAVKGSAKKATPKSTAKKSTNTAAKSQATNVPTATAKRRSVVLGPITPPATTSVPPTIAVTLPPITTTSTPTQTTPTTALPATTTSKATTTSIPSTAAFDFDLQIPSPRVSVNMGSSTPMLVLVLPRGVPRPVDLFFADLPNGMTATGTPNPTTGGSEVRLAAATLMVPGEYQLRVMAVAGTITKFVGYSLTVLAPGVAGAGSSSGATPASTSTTTTTIPSGSGGFTLTVTSDGKKLKTGGTVTLTAIVAPLSNFAGAATLRVLDVPENVWVGFQQNPSAGTSSIWLSSTLTLKAGSYPILVEARTSTQTSQIPIILTIE
jgi:hypothetical protein